MAPSVPKTARIAEMALITSGLLCYEPYAVVKQSFLTLDIRHASYFALTMLWCELAKRHRGCSLSQEYASPDWSEAVEVFRTLVPHPCRASAMSNLECPRSKSQNHTHRYQIPSKNYLNGLIRERNMVSEAKPKIISVQPLVSC